MELELLDAIFIFLTILGILIFLFIIFENSFTKLIENIKRNSESSYKILITLLLPIIFLSFCIMAATDHSNDGVNNCSYYLSSTVYSSFGKSSVSLRKNGAGYGYFLIKTPNAFGAKEENCVKCSFDSKNNVIGVDVINRMSCDY